MELQEGYKLTDMGVIPEDWSVLKLGEVFDFKNGLNKEKKYFGVGTPIVNYMDVYKKRSLTAKDIRGRVTVSNAELKAYNVRKDDVFFTRTSETVEEIGISSVIVDDLENTVFSGFVLRARPKNDWLDTFYKKYCFSSESVRKEIISKSSYTTRALTNGRLLSEVQIPLPPLPEQMAIADALSGVDTLIHNLDQFITKKRNIKQGAMQQLLAGNKRLAGFTDKWKVKRLGDIFDFKNGLNKEKKYFGSGTPIVNYVDVYTKRGLTAKDLKGRVTVTSSELNTYNVRKGDVFFTRTSETVDEIGLTSVILDDLRDTVFSGFILRARPKNNLLDTSYEKYCFSTHAIRKEITSKSSYTTRALTNGRLLSEVKISIPSLAEQKAIAQILSDMDEEIEQLKAEREKYRAVKQRMMQELLIGKTRLI